MTTERRAVLPLATFLLYCRRLMNTTEASLDFHTTIPIAFKPPLRDVSIDVRYPKSRKNAKIAYYYLTKDFYCLALGDALFDRLCAIDLVAKLEPWAPNNAAKMML